MSALMAERRDWAEDPRQASLFDVLAPPPERAKPEEAPREEARIVEFPQRPEAAPLDGDEPGAIETAAPDVEVSAPVDGPVGASRAAPPVEGDASAFEAASEVELAAMVEAPEAAAVIDTTPAVEGASAIEAEVVVAPEGFTGGTRTPRAAGSPLARPTLDDVMSRVWEGLSTGLPAACPVCRGELQPALSGPRQACCASCGTTID
jgi:hypothetical protein